jgi:hypothetical protein
MAKEPSAALRKYLAEIGRAGGKKAAKSLTKNQRSERARKAAAARWKKAKTGDA